MRGETCSCSSQGTPCSGHRCSLRHDLRWRWHAAGGGSTRLKSAAGSVRIRAACKLTLPARQQTWRGLMQWWGASRSSQIAAGSQTCVSPRAAWMQASVRRLLTSRPHPHSSSPMSRLYSHTLPLKSVGECAHARWSAPSAGPPQTARVAAKEAATCAGSQTCAWPPMLTCAGAATQRKVAANHKPLCAPYGVAVFPRSRSHSRPGGGKRL